MQNRPGTFGFNPGTLDGFEDWDKAPTGTECYADTMLRLDSPGNSSVYSSNSKGLKRKWGHFSRREHVPLVLGLGQASSSSESSRRSSATACTMSSAKDSEEESSMDLDLNFRLHLGNDNMPSPKKPAVPVPKALETRQMFDIRLSLSMGPSESVVTSITPDSIRPQNSLDTSLTIGLRSIVSDVSASSQWKFGSLIPLPHVPDSDSRFVCSQKSPKEVSSLQVPPELPSIVTDTLKSPDAFTSRVINPQRNLNTKNCQFQGCSKGARGASGFCIAHGGGRRCQKPGCDKGAEGKTVFCKAHGGGRRCMHLGCTKSAEGRTEYCIAHGGGRRCSNEGCPRAARGKSGLCIRHGGGKRCQKENCSKSAEGRSGLCISHGGGRRCQFLECKKGAQGSTMYCKAHGGGKRCTFPGCMKGAEGSTPFCKGHGGGKRCSFQGGCPKSVHGGTLFCVAHGGGKRCAIAGCTKSARGRTDFCVRHGGGKRCKSVGCGKSAQGSTDYCKAHGGGKRCGWGQPGSELGAGGPPCDRFARGKVGLCAAHGALVQDLRVHGAGTITPNLETSNPDKAKDIVAEEMYVREGNAGGFEQNKRTTAVFPLQSNVASLPEGRVHGGSLMALLASNAVPGSCYGNQARASTSEQGPSNALANWV